MDDQDACAAKGGLHLVSRRHFVVGLGLAASSALAFARQPQAHNRPLNQKLFEGWVPTQAGAWLASGSSGVVLPPPDALSDRLYDNLVTRVYESPGAPPVMMLLAYNNLQDGVVQVHRPEVCYPVGGYALSETIKVDIPFESGHVPASFFTATGPTRVEQVLYFTRLGDSYPRSWAEQRVTVMRANLAGDIPDGIMMRVSLLVGDSALATQLLKKFVLDFVAACPTPLRRLLVV